MATSPTGASAARRAGGGRCHGSGAWAKQVFVITEHQTKSGEPKLVESCAFPLTGVACVTRVYTSHAVVDIRGGRFILREKIPTLSLEELQAMTGARLHIDGPVADLVAPEL